MPSAKATGAATQEQTAKKRKTTKRAAGRTGKLRVRQVRSGIGSTGAVRRTLQALGLKHHQDVVIVLDNPSIHGMLRKVHHLVHVTPEKG